MHAATFQVYHSEKYASMYYKKGNVIGIRRKFGGKEQCMSFGGKRVGHSEAVLRGFADDAMKMLDAGATEKATKEWVDRAVSG